MGLISPLIRLHDAVFSTIARLTDAWLLVFLARFVFAAVLFLYFYNSALTKLGDGLLGFIFLSPGAYYQIALPAVEAAGGDVAAIPFFPWGLIVHLGTYGEILFPIMLVLGLFTRIAAAGMIGFVIVQTLVDITVHQVDAATIGALFDRFPDSVIMDQRTLWLFPLIYLVLKGGGAISLDWLLAKRFKPQHKMA